MTTLDTNTGASDDQPIVHDVPSALSPYIRRVVAENPGPMTGPGTNTYLVGIDEIAVIDPGPDTEKHLDAVAECGGDRVRWILLTHTHPDHAPGTATLKKRTGAEVCAFDDRDGVPVDRFLSDGDMIDASEFRLKAIHTPGHASNHLCYLLEEERTLFTGDHIMQGSTVVIGPPDGNMADYLASLDKIRSIRRLRAIAPGHGRVIDDPYGIVDDYIAHRLEREAQVLDGVTAAGEITIPELVADIYPDLIEELIPRAAQSVLAHLEKLADDGRVAGDGPDSAWKPA